ncbi:MAG: DUF1552 domain-containing protein [Planctomycetaceae bacterium]
MRRLDRRTFLRGTGAALSLPVLDAMLPRAVQAAEGVTGPTRLAFIYMPCGAIMPDWTPEGVGSDYKLSKTLTPLAAHREKLLVLSGLGHDKARANGDGAGDHARDSAAFLTASQPRKTAGADIKLGISVDQVAANSYGGQTRLPSLELGTEEGRQAGSCDSGYSCAYQSNIAWRSATQPMAKEIRPREVFERLFGDPDGSRAKQAERNFYRQSILDFVAEDSARLQKSLGQHDRRKLDEYLTSVREVELRIEQAADDADRKRPDVEPPAAGVPDDYATHVRLMYDLMLLAFQTDTTRISTFMLANSGSNRTYRELGVKGGHHEISHHRNDEEKVQGLQKIDQYMIEQFAYFLERLEATQEGDRSLLDRSLIVYGAAISDANRHQHNELPVLLAGGGNGTVSPGRHLRFREDEPMANLFLSLLDRVGVEEERFGDSTRRLEGLST